MKKASGILMPVFSLPSEYGIGCFSKEAYFFVDWLKLLADFASGTYGIWGFAISVLFGVCGESVFHRPGGTDFGRIA